MTWYQLNSYVFLVGWTIVFATMTASYLMTNDGPLAHLKNQPVFRVNKDER